MVGRDWTRGNVAAAGALLLAAAAAASALLRALEVDPFPTGESTLEPVETAQRIPPAKRPAMEEMLAATERDPFHPGRRPPAERYRLPGEEDPAADETAPAPRGEAPLRLIGTVVLPDGGSFALCRWGNDPAKLVRVGEAVGGLTLTRVEQGAAVFRSEDGSTLEIEVPKPGTTR